MQLTHADAPPQVPKHSVRFGFQLKVKCWETLPHSETEAKRDWGGRAGAVNLNKVKQMRRYAALMDILA